MTLQAFIDKYLGETLGYPDGRYVGQCLSLVKVYIKECFGINPPPSGSNSAYGYWSNFPDPLGTVFKKVVSTLDNFPKYGDIPIWKPTSTNSFGHIDVALDGASDAQFVGLDQNWDGKETHIVKHGYNGVIGWLTPIKDSEEDMTDMQKKTLEVLQEAVDLGLYGNVESAARSVVNNTKAVKRFETEVKEFDSRIKALEMINGQQADSIKEINQRLEVEVKLRKSCQTDLNTANGKTIKLEKQIETKEQEVASIREVSNKYQSLYKKALEKSIDKCSLFNFIMLKIKKLFKK